MPITLNGDNLTIEDVVKAARLGDEVAVDNDAWDRIKECRGLLERKMAAGETMYGVNTGIGELAEVRLPQEKTKEFQ